MRILVAEDEPRLLQLLLHILERNKFSVDGVSNGLDALEYARSGAYDGLVLDIMMPGIDGLQVLRQLRSAGVTTPALFLTARSEVSQRIEGLEAGADDYLPKPFSNDELVARVRAMLRRRDSFSPDLVTVEGVSLNCSAHTLFYNGRQLSLSGKEFQVAELLFFNPGQILSTEQFMLHIWGWNTTVDTSVVWVHTSNLRKKLAAIGAPLHIRFVRGVGYLLETT